MKELPLIVLISFIYISFKNCENSSFLFRLLNSLYIPILYTMNIIILLTFFLNFYSLKFESASLFTFFKWTYLTNVKFINIYKYIINIYKSFFFIFLNVLKISSLFFRNFITILRHLNGFFLN